MFINTQKYFLDEIFQEVKKRFKDGLPMLDPVDDMGIKDEGLKSIVRVLYGFICFGNITCKWRSL